MEDYKVLKEAFHADNPGASIWSINAVTLAALVGHSEFYRNLAHQVSPLMLCMHLLVGSVRRHGITDR
jgi:hypothetical protein